MKSSDLVKQYLPVSSEKLINSFIYELQEKEHKDEDYQKLLKDWENYLSHQRDLDAQSLPGIKVKLKAEPGVLATNLCEVCYDELPWRKKWCRICGCYCCDKCIARIRKVNQEAQPALFCDKCDKKYLQGMLALQFFQNLAIRETAFGTLGHEQELIESLLKIQRHKIMMIEEETGQKNVLIECGHKIIQLRSQNRVIQSEITEAERKLEWGNNINKQLTKKLRRTKKIHHNSFASSVNEDTDALAPPQADQSEAISVENLNESMLNSMFEDEQGQTLDGRKCQCRMM